MLRRLRRELAFAAAVPPRQIARRFWLVARRQAERRLQPKLAADVVRAAQPPLPLFPPRTGLVRREEDGWTFRFVGRELRIAGRIDWRAPGPGPRDQLWRMNLHYMEYLEALDDMEAAGLIDQWITANPPYRPGATSDSWNAYALSLRVVVWMQQLAVRALPADLVARAEKSLVAQLLYLERHLETDIGGNHLIKNIKALLWASACFNGAAATRWRTKGLRLLTRELKRQMLADGMHFERSPSYHVQVTADLLEIRHALGHDPIGSALDAALDRAAQAVADLAHADGGPAQFGDAGLHMAYAPEECLAAHQRLFGARPEPRPTFGFVDAGYYGSRHRDSVLILDAGPVAPASLPAHGHGDMLSFEWSVAGQRLIVDQGVFEYVAGDKRGASRSCRSHNTVAIEGMDQAEFFGAFRCGRQGRITVHAQDVSPKGLLIDAEHDGFAHLLDGPVHRRRFHGEAERFRIEDNLSPALDRPARAALLLHPDVEAEKDGPDAVRLQREGASARIHASHELELEPAVWWPDMGVEQATTRIVMALPPGTQSCWMEFEA